jgi:hypothetical protein
MTQLLAHIYTRNRKLLRCAAWSLLVILLLASLPFVIHLVNCGVDWIFGQLPRFHVPWQEGPL